MIQALLEKEFKDLQSFLTLFFSLLSTSTSKLDLKLILLHKFHSFSLLVLSDFELSFFIFNSHFVDPAILLERIPSTSNSDFIDLTIFFLRKFWALQFFNIFYRVIHVLTLSNTVLKLHWFNPSIPIVSIIQPVDTSRIDYYLAWFVYIYLTYTFSTKHDKQQIKFVMHQTIKFTPNRKILN